MDLDDEECEYIDVGVKVPIPKLFLKDYFIVSLAKAKTHDSVVATLSLKNILMGCISKIRGSEKDSMHSLGNKELNIRLAKLAEHIYPDLAIIDGFVGMEANGPVHGTPVDCRFAIASIDALSADRVCLECMSIPPDYTVYLNYIASKSLGNFDLNMINIIGNKIVECKKKFKLHDYWRRQVLDNIK